MSDYSDLVQRLRDLTDENFGDLDPFSIWGREMVDAADAIEAQAKRIAELEAALKPFDEMLQRDFSIMSDDERYDDDFTTKVLMRLGDLRAARKVLGEKE